MPCEPRSSFVHFLICIQEGISQLVPSMVARHSQSRKIRHDHPRSGRRGSYRLLRENGGNNLAFTCVFSAVTRAKYATDDRDMIGSDADDGAYLLCMIKPVSCEQTYSDGIPCFSWIFLMVSESWPLFPT